MKKVLMISHVFPPHRSVGHSIRVVKFIKYLPELGWQPVVLTIDDRKEYHSYLKQGSESLLSDIPKGVEIYRTSAGEPSLEALGKEAKFGQRSWITSIVMKIFRKARNWAFGHLLLPDWHIAWLPFALKRGRWIVKHDGIDAIFATCPPHSATLVGACLKRLTRKPLILDYRDDWIGTPSHKSKSRIRQMIERRMESWVVKTADRVILVTDWSRNTFLDRYPTQPREKFVFIPNGCDLEEFGLLKPKPAAQCDSTFMIVHAGSLSDSKSWTRTPATFFMAVRNLLKHHPGLEKKLTLAFTGSLPDTQKQLVKEMGLSDVVKELGFLPRIDLLHLMDASDILLVINYEGFSTLIPGKIYEYWAVGGAPILLLSCPGAGQDLIERHGLGAVVSPDDVDGIENALREMYLQRESGHPVRISVAGIEKYDRKVLASELAQVLSDLVPSR